MRLTGLMGLSVMVAAIAIAWGFQLIGGLLPCALCLEQRVPYYVAIPLAVAGLLLVLKVPMLTRLVFILGGLAMLWGAGLGVFHAGAEWGFWDGPNTCGNTGAEVLDASNLLNTIQSTQFVSCTQDTGRVLGLSFAGWNVVAASAAALLLLTAALRPSQPAPTS